MIELNRPYHPLSNASCIRLLNIDPDSIDDQPISCRLEELDLEHAQGYTGFSALSYRWGKQQASSPISLNGHKISIRQNLYDFLIHARRNEWTRNFWIDGLCINQDDLEEKSQQVARMGEIYSRATHVLIWLDNLSSTEQNAIAHLGRIGDDYSYDLPYHHLGEPVVQVKWKPLTLGNLTSFWYLWPRRKRELPENTKLGIELLARHPYWTRKWIVQEILLAGPNASVVLPHSQVKLANIATLLLIELDQLEKRRRNELTNEIWNARDTLLKEMQPKDALSSTTEFARSANVQREIAWDQWQNDAYHQFYCCRDPTGLEILMKTLSENSMTYQPQDISQLLDMYSEFECQEPADHIFALLSLVTSDLGITVDYGLDRGELYWSLLSVQTNKEDARTLKSERSMVHTLKYYDKIFKRALRLSHADVTDALGKLWPKKHVHKIWELQFIEAIRNCISVLRLEDTSQLNCSEIDTSNLRTLTLDYEKARLFPPETTAKRNLASLFLQVNDSHVSVTSPCLPIRHDLGIFDYNIFRVVDVHTPTRNEKNHPIETLAIGSSIMEIYDSISLPIKLAQIRSEGHTTALQHIVLQTNTNTSNGSHQTSSFPLQSQDIVCVFSGHQPALILRKITADKVVFGTAMRSDTRIPGSAIVSMQVCLCLLINHHCGLLTQARLGRGKSLGLCA